MVNEHIKQNHGVVVEVKNKEVIYNVTKRIEMQRFLEWVGGKKYKNLIVCTRTDEEINHPDYCPHEDTLSAVSYTHLRAHET